MHILVEIRLRIDIFHHIVKVKRVCTNIVKKHVVQNVEDLSSD